MEIVETDNPTQTTSEPAKIFDLSSGKMVDNPDVKKEPVAKKEELEVEEEEETPSEEEEAPEEAEAEEEAPEEESEEVEEEEESEEDEDETPSAKKDEFDTVEPDAYIAQVYGEKYGLKTEKELTTLVENALSVMDEVDALKKERDTLKADGGKPKFASPAHESAFNFVSQFDPSMQGEALQTFAKLITMDIDNGDPMMLLEEKFVHENPQWTRSEAQRMFKKDYAKKYTLARDKFDGTDEEFAEEQADMDIMKKGDIARSKTYLKELKSKHKPAEAEKPRANEAVVKAVEKNAKDYGAYIEKVNEFVSDEGGEKYTFKLEADKKKQVSDAMNAWVKNPASYDEKGELIGAGSPEEMFNIIVGGMFLKEIIKSVRSQVKNKVETQRVDEIGRVVPKKRKSPASGESKVNKDDLGAQARQLIKARKAAA